VDAARQDMGIICLEWTLFLMMKSQAFFLFFLFTFLLFFIMFLLFLGTRSFLQH